MANGHTTIDGAGANPAPTPQLTTIELERFKAVFKPVSVAIGPLTVLIGRNGSGKSTLIEALQWIDTTLRHDAVKACRRTHGVHDLVNFRGDVRHFILDLQWKVETHNLRYKVQVAESAGDRRSPVITKEELWPSVADGTMLIDRPESTDRLALWRSVSPELEGVRDFWRRAVFLRLSPARLAEGSLPSRVSSDPMLDEEGQNLPALLNELDDEQRSDLIAGVTSVLPDMQDISVSKPGAAGNETVHYRLHERMPSKGRTGRSKFRIPAWMLSEGTRRLTAIFALLSHRPAPSLLCIEEVENGLDPWAAVTLLRHLESAADSGVQVILTTHSPWLLDHVPMESVIQVRRHEGDTQYLRFSERSEVQAFLQHVPAGVRYLQEGR